MQITQSSDVCDTLSSPSKCWQVMEHGICLGGLRLSKNDKIDKASWTILNVNMSPTRSWDLLNLWKWFQNPKCFPMWHTRLLFCEIKMNSSKGIKSVIGLNETCFARERNHGWKSHFGSFMNSRSNIVQVSEHRLLFVSCNMARADVECVKICRSRLQEENTKEERKQLRKIQNLVSLNNSIYIRKQNPCNAMNVDSEPLSLKKGEKRTRKSKVGEKKFELNWVCY